MQIEVTLNTKTAKVSIAAQAARRLPSEARLPQLDLQSIAGDTGSMEAILNIFCGAHWPVIKN